MAEKALTKKEKKVLDGFEKKLKTPKPKTKSQVIVAMVGLVGSAREEVAGEVAKQIGAVLISVDEIRIALRKEGERYDNVRKISHSLAKKVLSEGGNVVLDSDYVSADKRNRLKKIAKDSGAKLFYIRTNMERDAMIGRIIAGKYPKEGLFGGAGTSWRGKESGAVVKLREMWRRTPHHYSWDGSKDGEWILKKLPFVFYEIDTTDSKSWKAELKKFSKNMK